MKEVPQVKFVDKVSFTFGVTCIVVTELLALRHPEYFTAFYLVLITGLLANRYLEYVATNDHLFMLDFCYFMNISVLLQTILFPDCLAWYKANYVLCMGVLMMAILVWQNSLVFHSLDKLTSIFIHVFPPLTLHLYRYLESLYVDETEPHPASDGASFPAPRSPLMTASPGQTSPSSPPASTSPGNSASSS